LLDAFLREPGMTTNKKKNDRPGRMTAARKKNSRKKTVARKKGRLRKQAAQV
jgi:hypothetical protein